MEYAEMDALLSRLLVRKINFINWSYEPFNSWIYKLGRIPENGCPAREFSKQESQARRYASMITKPD